MFYTAYHNKWLKYLTMLLGASISAMAVNLFIVPAGLYNGGILGFCQLIRTFLSTHAGLTFGAYDIAGILYYIANVPLFIYAARSLGIKIVFNSLLVTTAYTAVYSIVPIPAVPIIDDPLTACLLGGILAGLGGGMYLTSGATGGGIDLLALVLSKRGSTLSVGQFSIVINVVLYSICLILFVPSVAIYSVIFSIFTSMVLDRVHQQNVTIQATIFTRGDQKALAQYIMEDLHRGVTYWQGVGAYTQENVHVLYVCLSKYEVESLERVVHYVDPQAFITVQDEVHVMGNYQKKFE